MQDDSLEFFDIQKDKSAPCEFASMGCGKPAIWNVKMILDEKAKASAWRKYCEKHRTMMKQYIKISMKL